jgi:hypothetical protein
MLSSKVSVEKGQAYFKDPTGSTVGAYFVRKTKTNSKSNGSAYDRRPWGSERDRRSSASSFTASEKTKGSQQKTGMSGLYSVPRCPLTITAGDDTATGKPSEPDAAKKKPKKSKKSKA